MQKIWNENSSDSIYNNIDQPKTRENEKRKMSYIWNIHKLHLNARLVIKRLRLKLSRKRRRRRRRPSAQKGEVAAMPTFHRHSIQQPLAWNSNLFFLWQIILHKTLSITYSNIYMIIHKYCFKINLLPQEQCCKSCSGHSTDARIAEPNPWWCFCLPSWGRMERKNGKTSSRKMEMKNEMTCLSLSI